MTEQSTDMPEELAGRWRLYANSRALISRFLALAWKPRRLAPLLVDFWLLLQSTWSERQLGPDVVYPMLGIRKRQSGRLAKLILEHCRTVRQYKLRTMAPFPRDIDPPCVAVIDLDEVPQRVAGGEYRTQVDLYGLMCLLMLFETIVSFTIHVFYLFDWGWITWANWIYWAIVNLIICLYAVLRGDGILTLVRRSATSTPGCAMFLDQDFTVILNGSQSTVEGIAESSFSLSHPNTVWRLRLSGDSEDHSRDSSYGLLEALCEAACLVMFALCWLLFRPSTVLGCTMPMTVIAYISTILAGPPPNHFTLLQVIWFLLKGTMLRCLLPVSFLLVYGQVMLDTSIILAFDLQRDAHLLAIFLVILFSESYRVRNYPIRTDKILEALGHPHIKKWQFDTLAAAATFQCLVTCHNIARPIRSIDVLALLDMLIPDQRDVWKAWKERVADRIVHEVDISFTPTIPTFGDERQQQLKDLLDQAQLGDDTYRHFYGWHVPLYLREY